MKFLFDLDGTLTDAGLEITESIQYALKRHFHLTDAQGEEALRCYRAYFSVQGVPEVITYALNLRIMAPFATGKGVSKCTFITAWGARSMDSPLSFRIAVKVQG